MSLPPSVIADCTLAAEGQRRIDWAARHMPLLEGIERRWREQQPLKGLRVTLSIHLEAKTARLALLLRQGGAQVAVTGSNPLSTQDAIAAALTTHAGIGVYALHGATAAQYEAHLIQALTHQPHIVIDDGGDLVALLHGETRHLAQHVIGGCEETTTGVTRLAARAKAGELAFPMMNINDAQMKHLFDNRYGTGQSVWDAILRTTNLSMAGRCVVVAGYGWCGKGVAMRARGLGARVIICEVDAVKAAEALMDGYEAMPMAEAARLGELFITVTGCRDVIRAEHFAVMRDGAIACNAGHFDVEVNLPDLAGMAVRRFEARRNIEGFELADGRTIFILAEGRLVNLAAGDGHPVEIMDLSFALQALCAEYVARNGAAMAPGVYAVPEDIDQGVARIKLAAMGRAIDALTPEQAAYLASWEA